MSLPGDSNESNSDALPENDTTPVTNSPTASAGPTPKTPESLFVGADFDATTQWQHSFELTVREIHLDVYGHVNNAVYLTFAEVARWEFFYERGYDLEKINQLQLAPVILELAIQYKRELTLREKIHIQTRAVSQNRKVVKVQQVLFKEDGTVSANIVAVIGLLDFTKRKLVSLTDEWKEAMGLD